MEFVSLSKASLILRYEYRQNIYYASQIMVVHISIIDLWVKVLFKNVSIIDCNAAIENLKDDLSDMIKLHIFIISN